MPAVEKISDVVFAGTWLDNWLAARPGRSFERQALEGDRGTRYRVVFREDGWTVSEGVSGDPENALVWAVHEAIKLPVIPPPTAGSDKHDGDSDSKPGQHGPETAPGLQVVIGSMVYDCTPVRPAGDTPGPDGDKAEAAPADRGIVAGSVVVLRSGGPEMTVEAIDRDAAEVSWLFGTETRSSRFKLVALQLIR